MMSSRTSWRQVDEWVQARIDSEVLVVELVDVNWRRDMHIRHVLKMASHWALVLALGLDPLHKTRVVHDMLACQLDASATRQALRRVTRGDAIMTSSDLLADETLALAETCIKGMLILLKAQIAPIAVPVDNVRLPDSVFRSGMCGVAHTD